MEFPKISGTKIRSLETLQQLVAQSSRTSKYLKIEISGKTVRLSCKKIASLAIRLSQMSEEPASSRGEILAAIQSVLGGDYLQKEIIKLSVHGPTNEYTPLLVKKKASLLSKVRYETPHGFRKSATFLRSLFTRIGKKRNAGFGETLNDLSNLKHRLDDQHNEASPYELAALLGFKMSAAEIKKELEKVPTRANRGVVVHGEYEGNPDRFEEQLGLGHEIEAADTPFSEAFSSDAGVWEGYSIGTHSMMVLRMFDQHLSERFDKSNIVPKKHFRIFLMLHDIGKGLAVKEEGPIETKARKRKELLYCKQAIEALVVNGIIPRETGNLFKALLSDVTIGKFLQKKITLPQAVEELKKAMNENDVKCSPLEFFKLARLFHLADASAYKDLRAIPGLFEVNAEGKVRHAKTSGTAGNDLKQLKKKFTEPMPDLEKLIELENLLKGS